MALYGTYSNEKTLDLLLVTIIFFYSIELLLRVAVYGFSEFWFYARFNSESKAVRNLFACS